MASSRRIFIKQSLTAAGVTVLAQAHTWPAWAEAGVEGTVEKMGRIAFDPESGRTYVSWLSVDVSSREIETECGPTRVTEAVDRVLVKVKGKGKYSKPIDVSAGQPHAKLDPRIAARGGRVCVTWAGCHPETKMWSVFAAYSSDGTSFAEPLVISENNSLHPSVDLDPETGHAWAAFENWNDGSINVARFGGSNWCTPIAISAPGRNFRPRIILTDKNGKFAGAAVVVWDLYRDEQYDIFMRLIHPGGDLGPEMRVTHSPLWDAEPDAAEDKEGNIWVVWIRASTELANTNRLREVHARYWDGEQWYWPHAPEGVPAENGRITGYTACMHPRILADQWNRVHVFYRDTSGLLYGGTYMMTYQGGQWTEPRQIKDKEPEDALNVIWDYSVAITDNDKVVGVEDSLYVKRLGFASAVHPTRTLALPPLYLMVYKTLGIPGDETIAPAWPKREKPKKRTMELDGKTLTLLYGDTHTHSWTSDGIDPADWYYHFARDYAKLDYYALSDHDFTICNTPGLEAYIAFLPKMFNRPDFITFQAYEFSSQKTGHRVVVFEGNDRPTFPLTYPPKHKSNTHEELYAFLHKFAVAPESRVLVTAHNMFQMGNSFTGHDESLEPLYDVTSLHSLAELDFRAYKKKGEKRGGGIWVVIGNILALGMSPEQKRAWHMCWREALDAGLLLGAYGTSDSHQANGIGYVTSAVWAQEKSRAAIFDALFAKHSFGQDSNIRTFQNETALPDFTYPRVSMLRADVRFYLDDSFMGSRVQPVAPPTARVMAENLDPSDPVRAVVFVKDGQDRHTVFGEGKSAVEVSWTDEDFTPGRHYYYARIEFESGNCAFSTPVFAG